MDTVHNTLKHSQAIQSLFFFMQQLQYFKADLENVSPA